MKWSNIVLIVGIISIFFLMQGSKVIEEVGMCGYNSNEANTIIVEDGNKCLNYQPPVKEDLKRLMIVAHPDDETIFGGAHLIEEKYTVVCITCGAIDYRVNEFTEVMKRTNDDYMMLNFTDRLNKIGSISNWVNEYNDIYNSLKAIIESDDWDIIVTHNPSGEYGHIHHIKTSEIVTSLVDKNKLYYFGHWSKNGSNEVKINNDLYNNKLNNLISVYYNSQKVAINYNYKMLLYENWIKAIEW